MTVMNNVLAKQANTKNITGPRYGWNCATMLALKFLYEKGGHTANIESCRIETEPDIDHVFSDFPNSIIPFVKSVEGVPESHTVLSAHGGREGHEDVQDENCGEHEDHKLPKHCS